MLDVKETNVDTNVEGSSSSESEINLNEENLESQASADSLNTDEGDKTVPYDRFKEVNDKKNELEKVIEENKLSVQLINAINDDPELKKNFEEMIDKHSKGKQKQDTNTVTDDRYDRLEKQIKAKEDERRMRVMAKYEKSFYDLATKDFPKDKIKALGAIASTYLIQNKDWLDEYDFSLVNDAYNKAKGIFDGYAQGKISNAATTKKTTTPSTTTGEPPAKEEGVFTEEDARNELAEIYKKRNE